MNPLIKFYLSVLGLLKCETDEQKKEFLFHIMDTYVYASWLDDIHVINLRLGELREFIDGVGKSAGYLVVRDKFLIAAFKDLSPIKNPVAMGLFNQLCKVCNLEPGKIVIWARRPKKREDGSAVITLHVSDYARFKNWVSGDYGPGRLEDCIIRQSF